MFMSFSQPITNQSGIQGQTSGKQAAYQFLNLISNNLRKWHAEINRPG
jgi:hypothetical protein